MFTQRPGAVHGPFTQDIHPLRKAVRPEKELRPRWAAEYADDAARGHRIGAEHSEREPAGVRATVGPLTDSSARLRSLSG